MLRCAQLGVPCRPYAQRRLACEHIVLPTIFTLDYTHSVSQVSLRLVRVLRTKAEAAAAGHFSYQHASIGCLRFCHRASNLAASPCPALPALPSAAAAVDWLKGLARSGFAIVTVDKKQMVIDYYSVEVSSASAGALKHTGSEHACGVWHVPASWGRADAGVQHRGAQLTLETAFLCALGRSSAPGQPTSTRAPTWLPPSPMLPAP